MRIWGPQRTKEDDIIAGYLTGLYENERELSNEIERILVEGKYHYQREPQCWGRKSRADFVVYYKDIYIEAKISSKATDFDRALGQAVRYAATEVTITWLVVPGDLIIRRPQRRAAEMIGMRIVKVSDLAKELSEHEPPKREAGLNPVELLIHDRVLYKYEKEELYTEMWKQIHIVKAAAEKSGAMCLERVKAAEGV